MKSLQIMSPSFEKLGELALYESLSMTRSYYGTGSISITIDPRVKNAAALQPNSIVFFGDESEQAYIIEDVSPVERSKMTVKGCMLKGYAKRYICIPPASAEAREYQDFGWDRFTGSAEAAYLHFADVNMVNPDDVTRKLPAMFLSENNEVGPVLPWQARFDKLDQLFRNIGETTEVGWNILQDIENKRFVFKAWNGLDRTQGSDLCLISEENGNASEITYKYVSSGSASTIYVGGSGEDENRFVISVGGENAFPNRREIWAEAGSIDDPELLKLYGTNKLTDAAPKETLIAKLIDSGACKYGRDYDVGDKVIISGRGRVSKIRLVEMTKTYEKGAVSLSGVFGDSVATVERVLEARKDAIR